MTIHQAITAGRAGDKLSRVLTGTNQVSAGRSAVATASGALLGGVATGSVVVAASTVGFTAVAVAAAPLVVPVAAVAAVVGCICSLWD